MSSYVENSDESFDESDDELELSSPELLFSLLYELIELLYDSLSESKVRTIESSSSYGLFYFFHYGFEASLVLLSLIISGPTNLLVCKLSCFLKFASYLSFSYVYNMLRFWKVLSLLKLVNK